MDNDFRAHLPSGQNGPQNRRVRRLAGPLLAGTLLLVSGAVPAAPAVQSVGQSLENRELADTAKHAGEHPVAGQFQRAARRGDRDAQNSLGDCFANGWGVARDLAEAAG